METIFIVIYLMAKLVAVAIGFLVGCLPLIVLLGIAGGLIAYASSCQN